MRKILLQAYERFCGGFKPQTSLGVNGGMKSCIKGKIAAADNELIASLKAETAALYGYVGGTVN